MEECREEKIQQKQHIAELRQNAALLLSRFQAATQKTNMFSSHQLMPGDAAEHPAIDCYWIKQKTPHAVSGFYWVQPRCAKKALRGYCDMDSGSLIYVLQQQDIPRVAARPPGLLSAAADIRLACGSLGLEAFVPRSFSQLHSAVTAIELMGIQLEGEEEIPIAFDSACSYGQCSATFRDLHDGTTDLTGLVLSLAAADTSATAASDTAVGVCLCLFVFFLYSPFSSLSFGFSPALPLRCEDVMEGHEAFRGSLNTNVLVECPAGCTDTDTTTAPPVFGSGGVYSGRSGICAAAVHAGITSDDGGVFVASIESPLFSFEGSKQNGVESLALELPSGDATTRTMRLSKISEECPEGPAGYAAASASSLHARPLTSFVELTTRIRAVSPAAAPAYDPALAAAEEAAKERISKFRCCT
ncbi:LCCL domain-containing protein CCP1, related [Eimeria mitis]|uniref:LCCL domain-containing protein CCP1, related n=1 Tax=Eimeria mitis TaxID=44415 RepID=U6K8I4_9EIME|nr:LCCL domain-containing protein CCP1, related [Eimeria mitis]CDJ34269.1 LCCL domain-containing protein CCP1, related [Eimeria mitis]